MGECEKDGVARIRVVVRRVARQGPCGAERCSASARVLRKEGKEHERERREHESGVGGFRIYSTGEKEGRVREYESGVGGSLATVSAKTVSKLHGSLKEPWLKTSL